MAFGGLLNKNSRHLLKGLSVSQDYIYLNFNDTLSSFITLFLLMLISGWNFVAEMYVATTGSEWTKVFFITFYMLSSIMMLNIIVAFVIDMYMSVYELHHRDEDSPKMKRYSVRIHAVREDSDD